MFRSPRAKRLSRATSASRGKPTPVTEWIMPMPFSAMPSAARSMPSSTAGRDTEPVTKSVAAKKASWFSRPDSPS